MRTNPSEAARWLVVRGFRRSVETDDMLADSDTHPTWWLQRPCKDRTVYSRSDFEHWDEVAVLLCADSGTAYVLADEID